MDLAKIRKKARSERAESAQSIPGNPMSGTAESDVVLMPAAEPVLPEKSQDLSVPAPTKFEHQLSDAQLFAEHQVRKKAAIDPIEAILAGREAAGCEDDEQQTLEQITQVEEDYEEFLCIRVADETYGINIMQIKEIIKPREVTEVPRAPSFVSGVISLRGVIIPVIDLTDRLGLIKNGNTGKERVVVIKNRDEFAGLIVNEVIQVVRINKNSFETAPAVLEGIDRDFVSGIGRFDSRMIIMLNIQNIADINMY